MSELNESKQFVPLRIAVLTVSDTRMYEDDRSGATLAERIVNSGHEVADRAIVPDDVAAIRGRVEAWLADLEIDVVITTGAPASPAAMSRRKRSSRCSKKRWKGSPPSFCW